jgi:hypothetical protein
MILVDLNQIAYATILSHLGSSRDQIRVDAELLRHMVLNTLRANRKKFHREFGELVICCDGRNYWRKKQFPYYKARRRDTQSKSPLDWESMFTALHTVEDEIKEFLPYSLIKVEGAEADDIIAVLIQHSISLQKHLILSGDKDYIQLHAHLHSDVKQFDPIRKRWISHPKPGQYLREHIIKGDVGDGIPNVLSPDSTFVSGTRQKTMTQKRLAQLMLLEDEEIAKTKGFGNEVVDNLKRNRKLIDFANIPESLCMQIADAHSAQQGKNRKKLFDYFVSRSLKNLMEHINDF